MSFFEQLEDECIAKLQPLVADNIDVENFPEKKAGIQPAVEKPRVSVLYASEKGQPNEITGMVVQPGDTQVIFKIEGMRRRGTGGIYEIIEKVKELILGWMPTHCNKPMIFMDGHYDELMDQTWIYYATYQCTRTIVEKIPVVVLPHVVTIDTYNPAFDGSFEGSWEGSF